MTRFAPILVLICAGAAWGATQPLAKLAVSGGYRPLGIVFWQLLIGALVLGAVCTLRRRPLRFRALDLRLYIIIALIGTVLPGIASYSAAVHLPSGVLSILLSTVPMLAFPIALAMGHERFRWQRLGGLFLGFCGILLLVAPGATLAGGIPAFWVCVAVLASLCYALEGNIVAKLGTDGLDAVQVLYGASLVGALISLPLALATGQFIDPRGAWGAPDLAIVASSLLHAGAYVSYVWMVGRAGPVFAVQISYLVTLFGVTWAMLFLKEAYAPTFWAALLVMMAGVALVQPRRKEPLVPPAQPGHTDPA